MRRILLYLVAAWLICVFFCGAAERERGNDTELPPGHRTEWRISDDLQVRTLRPGVWVHTSWKTLPNGVRFPSNGLILTNGMEAALVDTAWGVEATARLLDWVDETLQCPVTMAVVTHSHDDRALGVPVLVTNGIPVFAESRTVALAGTVGETNLTNLGRLEVGEALEVGPMQVFFPGAGHSPDNVVVWIPAQNVLFGGCLVKAATATTLGNTNDADVPNWPQAIALVQEQYEAAEIVVPGHGAVGGLDLLEHTRALLDEPRVDSAAPIPVILDTDIGSDIDDTWALAYLLKSPELDPKLILTSTGDTEYRAAIVARFLEIAGRTDIPIGLGPRGGSAHEYQKPWVVGFDLNDYQGTVHADGVQQLIDIIHASPVAVTIIAIGPTGNIAEALRRDPSIASKARYVGMQGSIDVGYGEGPPVAEANVRGDAAAFRTVLEANWLDCQITPLDTCGNVALSGERYQRVSRSADPGLQALIQNYRIWSELVTWINVDFFDQRSSTLFDVVAIYMAYSHDHLDFEAIPIQVTDDGRTVRHLDCNSVDVAIRWHDQPAFLDHLTDRLVSQAPSTSRQ